MKIEVNLNRKLLFVLGGVLIMVWIFVFVGAYNPSGSGGVPSTFGHSVDEVDWSQQVGSNVDLGGDINVVGDAGVGGDLSVGGNIANVWNGLRWLDDGSEIDGASTCFLVAGTWRQDCSVRVNAGTLEVRLTAYDTSSAAVYIPDSGWINAFEAYGKNPGADQWAKVAIRNINGESEPGAVCLFWQAVINQPPNSDPEDSGIVPITVECAWP